MGRRGPAPKPTVIKELSGNPGKRPLNEFEASPRRDIPQVPKHLSDEAKKEWHRIVKDLFDAGLFTAIDRTALAAYCQAYGRWVKAEALLENEGSMVEETDKGYKYQSPYLSIANTAMDQMKKFLIEFGMTPAARSRIEVKPKDEPDELERMLFGAKVQVKK